MIPVDSHYNNLAQIIYNSFAGLGIKAGGGTITAAQLLQPGKLAQVGIDSGKPILTSISGLMGSTSFFDNFIQIAILLIAWLIVVMSFFIMAIQLFVSLIEFKLTTLAGFVLVPFALFGRTAFLAERVLGNVVSSGVKILALAVIVGIGSTIFGQFTTALNNPPTISDALTLILAALTLLGLSIFGPGIANGLIAGGPQLGAGAAVGTGLAVAGIGAAGAGLAAAGVGAVGAAGGAMAGAARGGARFGGSPPEAAQAVDDFIEPLHIVSSYGLFAVMTTERNEIVVEGSNDGAEWREYDFLYKPGDVMRRPRWNIPHQPRLDWQMWFAALDNPRYLPWFTRFLERLLANEPTVTALLERNPFPDKPPIYVRAQFYDYTFAGSEEKAMGRWWDRRLLGLYFSVVELKGE